MKRCPYCDEPLLDWVEVCPICGNRVTDDVAEDVKFTVSQKVSVTVNPLPVIPIALYGYIPSVIDMKIRNKTHYSIEVEIYAEIEEITDEYRDTLKLNMFEEKEKSIKPAPIKRGVFPQLNEEKESQLKYGINVAGGEKWVKSAKVIILPYRDMPWILGGKYIAAWVTPREKLIEGKLLRDAVEEMEKLTAETEGIFGYQGEVGDIILQLWGIYNALKNYEIKYINTPLSLFKEYQRIRLPREVIEEKSGNCIELAVTFASAVEATDMSPVIILFKNHAITGVILPKIEEENDLPKEIKESLIYWNNYPILPIETTLIPSEEFLKAVKEGKREIEEKDIEEIVLIKDARYEGIQPMQRWLK